MAVTTAISRSTEIADVTWQEALQETWRGYADPGVTFKFGAYDCCQFIFSYLAKLQHYACTLRHKYQYTSQLQLDRLIKREGGTLERVFTKVLGPPDNNKTPGSVAIVGIPGDDKLLHTAGVLNNTCVIAYTEEGLIMIPHESVLASWEVT